MLENPHLPLSSTTSDRNRRSLTFLIVVGLFGIGLGFTINILDPFLYTAKTRLLAPPALKNTILGFITIMSLIVALVIQPLMGYWSDRFRSRWGKRIPFLTGGAIGLSLSLFLLLVAEELWLMVVAAMLISASTNTTQGAWQALIPDYVPKWQHGTAAGIKTLLELIGAVAGVAVMGLMLARGNLWGAPMLAIILFFIILLITLYSLPQRKTVQNEQVEASPSQKKNTERRDTPGSAQESVTFSLSLLITPQLLLKFAHSIFRRMPSSFLWWMLNRFLFWSAAISIRTFMLNYMEDVLSLSLADAEALTNRLFIILGLGVFVLALPAGAVADRIGRRPLMVAAGLMAASGVVLFVLIRDVNILFVSGGLVAGGAGIYASASWALATDLVPGAEGARYLALANIATVLGSIGGRLGGPLIDGVNHLSGTTTIGYLVVYGIAALFFAGSSLAVLKISERFQS